MNFLKIKTDFNLRHLLSRYTRLKKGTFYEFLDLAAGTRFFFEHTVFTEMSAILAFNSMPSQKKIVRAKIEKNPKRSVLGTFWV